VKDATAAARRERLSASEPAQVPRRETERTVLDGALNRRRVLALALLTPMAAAGLGACGTGTARRTKGPDPLIALADAARADAALAAAAVAANPALSARVEPLRAARTEHAAALDAEVVRAGGTAPSAAPTASAPAVSTAPPPSGTTVPPTGVTQSVTLARVREAVAASQRGAAQLVPDLPAERVGLVASVAACCATYAAVLA
jgi:hypothetical protein